MANADGSVIFSCDLDSTKAQKKLSKLRDEISELNSKLEKETGNKMNLEKQLDAASQAAKATEERVKMLRKEVERLNDREWIQKQGFTQNEYQTQVLDRRAAAEAELKQQEALLHTQTKEVKTLSAAYEETTANIDSMTVKLDKAKVAAGEMIANVEQERKEREAENSALAKAGRYAARFRDQVKSLARSMLVFSVITAALTALRKQIKAAIATSAEASDAFARLKGALLTLAAPLMDVLIPALTWLMNLLAAIVSEIVTIISILSGKSKKSMEASGKNLYKEAAAIDATGKAAKEATDALAAFDEINKLSTTTSVGGGGGGASAIAPDFDFDEGPMMEKLDKVFQKINDIFKTIRAGLEIVVDDLKWSFDKKVIPKSKATWLTVLMALLGATLGAAFGGITGGVIGLSLGVLLGLYLVGLDPETWKTEMDAEDAWIVVITALLGALLGSVFLGITGGVAGFSLGAILGLYLTGFADRRAVRAAWCSHRLYRDAGRRYSRRHGIRPDSRTEHLQRPQRPEEGHAAACQHRAQRTSWTAGRCSWRWPCSAGHRQRRYCIYYLGSDRPCAEILRRQCGRFQSQKGNVRLYRHARINKGPNAQPSRGGAELRRQCACV